MKEEICIILEDQLGIRVHPTDIYPVKGFWKRVDVYRFEIMTKNGLYGCWDTMKVFVRDAKKYGCCVDHKRTEIWANQAISKRVTAGVA